MYSRATATGAISPPELSLLSGANPTCRERSFTGLPRQVGRQRRETAANTRSLDFVLSNRRMRGAIPPALHASAPCRFAQRMSSSESAERYGCFLAERLICVLLLLLFLFLCWFSFSLLPRFTRVCQVLGVSPRRENDILDSLLMVDS